MNPEEIFITSPGGASTPTCCQVQVQPQPERAPLSQEVSGELELLFKVMANANRIRMINSIITAGEICVGDLAAAVGTTPQAVSNQLQRLVDRGMLASRREGNYIYYRLLNPCVAALLDYGLCILQSSKDEEK